ncbi:MAG: hypothetical protein HOO96_13645 [Polyangiaceae bacterium]|nr:hypothetical protein [Polyangiaceae bacterium]
MNNEETTFKDDSAAVVRVEGKDRLSWLNGLVTCELAGAAPGQAIYGLFVSRVGKIQSDLWVLVAESAIYMVVPAASAEALSTMLDAHLIMEDAVMTSEPDLLPAFAFGSAPAAGEGVRGTFRWAGEEGSLTLVARGADLPSGPSDAVRLRHGWPRFGVDFDATMLPHEASLEGVAVSFNKGCYLGQEVVCMVELRGQVKRKLVRLALPALVAPATAVLDADGNTIGETKSAALVDGVATAFALVKRAQSEPGASVHVAGAAATIRPAVGASA